MCRVFISHSERDSVFVEHVRRSLYLIDVECMIAEYKPDAGKDLWDKIQHMIEESYIVLVVLTASGIESEWVNREITIAKTLNKKFIPVVEPIVKERIPDPLRGKEYIPFDNNNQIETLEKIAFQLKDLKKNDLGFSMNC